MVQSHNQCVPDGKWLGTDSHGSTLIASAEVVAGRIGRKAAGALRSPSARRVLITTAITTSTRRHLNIAISLRGHSWATKSALRLIPVSPARAWSSHGGLMVGRICRHRVGRIGRMRRALRSHGSRTTTVLGKSVTRRCLRKAGCLWLLRRISVELTGWWTIFTPLVNTALVDPLINLSVTCHQSLTLHFKGRPLTL